VHPLTIERLAMKTSLFLTAELFLVFFTFTSGTLAQDWKNTNPKMNNVLVDTTLLRAMVVTVEPGEKSDVHTHTAHFFYALTDGKLLVNYTDGKVETYDLKAGDSGFSDPERPHTAENVGKQTLKFLLVELKEHPYKK
jgi:quercetin dioxygenase-like cupin family protein